MDVFAKLLRDIRTGLVTVLVLFLFTPASVWALGVGTITVESALDEPLKAHIDLLGVKPDDIESLSVDIAPNDVFDRMGIEHIDAIDSLRFRISQSDDGKHIIKVSSEDPVREPFMNFLIEVNWANGRLLREFTILLDPPVFEEEPEQSAAPVETPESGAPESFTITTPESAPEEVADVPEVRQGSLGDVQALAHGPVKRGEALWNIAESMRPKGASLEQMMLALLRENPEAFYGNNVSMLKEGAILRIDYQDKITSISAEEAMRQITQQHNEWIAYKRQRAADRAVAAESADRQPIGESGESASTEMVSTESRLKLVAPSQQEVDASNAQANADELRDDLQKITDEFALASEAMEVAGKENTELQQRLTLLEGQMQSMQRLLKLKDQQLSLLQEQIEDSGMEPVVDASAPIEAELPGEEMQLTGDIDASIESAEMDEQSESNWLDDPFTLATLVGMILLISILFWVIIRNKRQSSDAAREHALDVAAFQGLDDQTGVGEVRVISSDSQNAVSDAKESGSTALSSGLDDTLPEPAQPGGDLDPISEADVYLAYEKFDKAEALLKTAIQADPDRHELKLKLLETYFTKQDREAFEVYAEELYAALGGEESSLWQTAKDMGQGIAPENPLFGGADESSVVVDADITTAVEEQTWAPTQVTEVEVDESQSVFGEAEDKVDSNLKVSELELAEDSEPLPEASSEPVSGISSDLELQSESEPAPEPRSEPISGLDTHLELAQDSEFHSATTNDIADEIQSIVSADTTAIDDTSVYEEAETEGAPHVLEVLSSDKSEITHIDASDMSESVVDVLEVSSDSASGLAPEDIDFDTAPLTEADTVHLDAELPEPSVLDKSDASEQTVFVDSTIAVGHDGDSDTDEDEVKAKAAIAEQFAMEEAERIAQSSIDDDSSLTTQLQTEAIETEMLENSMDQLQAETEGLSDIDLDSMPSSELMNELAEAENERTEVSEMRNDEASFVAETTSVSDSQETVFKESIVESETRIDTEATESESLIADSQDTISLDEKAESENSAISNGVDSQPINDPQVSEADVNDSVMSSAEEGHDYAESSFFLLADEVGTKLDLAKAYMEMGDKDGARELLAEVLEEGNELQKKEARILLQSE